MTTRQSTRDYVPRTKLYRPPFPTDFVRRPRLLGRLEQAHTTRLTLVVAPAGYGKSLQVSDWLESHDEACAWLSLDSTDDDTFTFLNGLLVCLESALPGACPQTLCFTQAPELPPTPVLADCLAEELNRLPAPLTLVLDDYHRLGADSAVHELLRQ